MAFMNLDRQIIGGIVPAILTVSILVGMCSAQIVPAIFVFGDSLLDAGNNNYILTLSKANYVPNGIDFGMPTGRFTNGRTVADIIGKCEFSTTLYKTTGFCSTRYANVNGIFFFSSSKFSHQVRNWALKTSLHHTWLPQQQDLWFCRVSIMLLVQAEFLITLESSL